MPVTPASQAPASTRHLIGTVLCRLIVPLWVLAGAAFKLYERNPGNLPSVIRDFSKKQLGMEDLNILLRVLIGLEFFAVAVMLFMPRYARAMAIFMLSCFCAILIGEIATGAATCGCFGSLPIKPWMMLVIDGALLLLVIAFPSGARSELENASRSAMPSVVAAVVLLGIGLGIAIGVPNPPAQQQQVIANNGNGVAPPTATQPDAASTGATEPSTLPTPPVSGDTEPKPAPAQPPAVPQPPSDPTINPTPRDLPASWFTQKMDEWIGKPWRELELFQMMPRWPREMDKGPRYIVFYSRTCDHCKTMLDIELVDPLDGLTTLVEVPASRTVMTDPNGWEMPMSVELILGAELLQLPLGPNWVVTTPLVIKVLDGRVVCVTEGSDHKKCLGLP